MSKKFDLAIKILPLILSVGLFIDDGWTQVFIPLSFRARITATLTISDGPTYAFGTIALSTPADKIFTITNSGTGGATNMSGAAFSNAAYTFKGGSYPGTGGTCTSALSPNSNCTVVVTANNASAATIADTVTINYRNPATGNLTTTRAITATFANTASQLSWSSPPNYIRVNDCQALTLQRLDSGGNPVITGAATTITGLIFNNGINGTYYSDSGCTATITTSSIASGANSVTIYFRNTTSAQSGILVATATGLVGASKNVIITTNPTRLFINPSPTMKTATCTVVPIQTVDANFYPANATGTITINLTTTGANTYFSDSGCSSSITSTTILAGTSSRTIYTSNASIQTATLSATDAAAGLTSSSKSVNFNSSLTWWNASWPKRIRIDINNADQATAFTNQPVLVRLNSTRVNYSDILANGADIRFVASDDTTVLDHERDFWTTSGNSDFWVRIPSISASSSAGYFYMYYNNSSASDSQNPSGVWANFWSVWHLGNDPSATAPQYTDSKGSVRNGTATNSPVRTNGVIGQAVDLNGATDNIDINSDLSVALGASSTLSMWMRTTQTGSNTPWVAPGITGVEQGGGGNDIFFGFIDATGLISVTAGNGAIAKSSFVVNNNAWRHVTITRNSTSGVVAFYINGVANGTATSETGNKTTYFDLLGAIINAANYNGLLDEVRIYNSVQTAAQIMADFKFMNDSNIQYGTVESGP